MNASAFVSSALLVSILAWTLFRYLDPSGEGPGTLEGKCFGILPWGVITVTVAVITTLTWMKT